MHTCTANRELTWAGSSHDAWARAQGYPGPSPTAGLGLDPDPQPVALASGPGSRGCARPM